MNDRNSTDIYIGIALGFVLGLYFLFSDPFLLWIIIPTLTLVLIVLVSGSNKRDEYFKAKKSIMAAIAVVGFFAFTIYYFYDSDFIYFYPNQNDYVLFSSLLVALFFFLNWLSKGLIPISFRKDDDRIVQETMYEDYDYQPLGDTFIYRYSLFVDESRKKLTPKDIGKTKSKTLTPLELNTQDIEMEAINDKDELKFYYEKLIYDMFNDFIEGGKNQNKILEMYGYNLTIVHGIKSQTHFKKVLKKHSLLYYKIFCFLEADMKKDFIGIKLRWKNLYDDNLHCLELCLISAILMVRQYMNFPVGDLAKYVKTTKDKNFIGAFSSLPADFDNVNSTSANASGIGYYYTYYKLHLNRFQKESRIEIEKRWLE